MDLEHQDRNFKMRYGISLHERNQLLRSQQNKCAMCGRELGRFPHVDHNHATGKIRGMLCAYCNSGLHFIENMDFFESAIHYLRKTDDGVYETNIEERYQRAHGK